jgi:hypothetical protein
MCLMTWQARALSVRPCRGEARKVRPGVGGDGGLAAQPPGNAAAAAPRVHHLPEPHTPPLLISQLLALSSGMHWAV